MYFLAKDWKYSTQPILEHVLKFSSYHNYFHCLLLIVHSLLCYLYIGLCVHIDTVQQLTYPTLITLTLRILDANMGIGFIHNWIHLLPAKKQNKNNFINNLFWSQPVRCILLCRLFYCIFNRATFMLNVQDKSLIAFLLFTTHLSVLLYWVSTSFLFLKQNF